MNRRKKKKHTGCLISLIIVIAIGAVSLVGGRTIINSIKTKAAKAIAQKLLEDQIKNNISSIGNIDVSEIVNNMADEDVQAITDMVDKYIGLENAGDYIDMVKDGDLSEVKKYVKDNITESDMAQLQSLYEKYKDQIPIE